LIEKTGESVSHDVSLLDMIPLSLSQLTFSLLPLPSPPYTTLGVLYGYTRRF